MTEIEEKIKQAIERDEAEILRLEFEIEHLKRYVSKMKNILNPPAKVR